MTYPHKRAGLAPVWSPDEEAVLKALWQEGLSARQIAERMPGRSKNAVIGRAHRLKLASRPSPIKRKSNVVEFKPRGCEWPEGSETPYTFCGAPVVNHQPYCCKHMLLSIRKEHRPALRRALRKAGERV